MAVRPVEISGMIQRTDDIGLLKQQQDSRPMVEQHQLQSVIVKREDNLRHQVLTPNESAKSDTHADAREEGKNAYVSKRKIKKKKSEDAPVNRVIKKNAGGSFDMKV